MDRACSCFVLGSLAPYGPKASAPPAVCHATYMCSNCGTVISAVRMKGVSGRSTRFIWFPWSRSPWNPKTQSSHVCGPSSDSAYRVRRWMNTILGMPYACQMQWNPVVHLFYGTWPCLDQAVNDIKWRICTACMDAMQTCNPCPSLHG
jgi:hypothetical protein